MTTITREELEAALTTLTGDNGRIYPVSALSNPEAVGHESVTKALCIAMEDECFTGYLDRYEWDAMNEDERAEYAEDYAGFCEVCDSFNSSVISNAVRMLEKKIGK